jgi:hypothetical protein
LPAFVKNADLLDRADLGDPRSVEALRVLRDFLDGADELLEEYGADELTNEELLELLNDIDFSEEPTAPIRAPQTFEGEMEKSWGRWADLLFVRCFKEEIQKMQEFQARYTPVLKQRLADAGNLPYITRMDEK